MTRTKKIGLSGSCAIFRPTSINRVEELLLKWYELIMNLNCFRELRGERFPLVKNYARFRKFEDDFLKNQGELSYQISMKLFTAMWNEASSFGILPPKEPLEGIEVDIRIARVLNSCLKKSFLR